MIELINVTKKFGDFTAIEDMNLKINEGSIHGVVGYNGAGKTTMLKVIAGIYKADGGMVLVDGEDVFDNAKIREKMFFIADETYIPRGYSLDKMRKLMKGYYPNFNDDVYNNMVEAMGLDPKKNIHSFSKGMRRQSEIVIAMATMPKYLLLDECFDGIDPQKRNLCKKIFIEYMAEFGCSIIICSHNLQEIGDFCDRVALLNGKNVSMDVNVDDISAAYKKYRIIFENEITKSDFDFVENKGVTIDGRMATIIVSSDVDDSVFAKLNPVHIDSVALSLEEVFLNEMEDKDYDISKIFSK